jgi:CheY-like chemotaxis protein
MTQRSARTKRSSSRMMKSKASRRGRSIVVADDELGFRELFRFTFEPLGFEVVTAADGIEALDVVRERAFDLVILDVHMPRMGGPEAFAQVRQIRPDQRILIVSSSSDPTNSFERAVLQAGAADCLFKPMDLDELIAAVEKALAG